MRVFQLNTFCGEKSTGRIALEIARLVEQDGGQCRIGYGAGKPPKEAEPYAFRIGTPLERKVCSQLRKTLDFEGRGCYFGTKALIDELERFQPDLVHFHNLHGCYLHLPSLCENLTRRQIPIVWTLHDCWPFTGHCAYFDYAHCEKWKTGCEHCPQQRSYPICVGLDRSRKNYEMKKQLFAAFPNLTMVVPCDWMKVPLSQSFLADRPVRRIYNGVDRDAFHPRESFLRQEYGLSEKKVALAVASDWDERKGLSYLLETAERLGDAYRIVAVGLTKEQISALPPSLIGIEHTNSAAELAQWYTTADCLVNPSMEDNMPMVNLEALACGTPVAAFRTGGCPEAVDETCGVVVEQGNVEEFCSAVQTLCERKEEMRDACLRRAEHFDSRKTFERYIALYKELCP